MRKLCLGALLAGACAPAPEPLVELPDFGMTQVLPDGERRFGRADLLGRVWIADFVFTRCSGPCPLLTGRLAELAAALPPEAGFLTVTVDPGFDDAARLRRYARAHGSDLRRWVFLRGSSEETYRLVFAAFRQTMSTQPDKPEGERVMHSTKLVLIDKKGVVRGYYDGLGERDRARVERDARALLKEAP